MLHLWCLIILFLMYYLFIYFFYILLRKDKSYSDTDTTDQLTNQCSGYLA